MQARLIQCSAYGRSLSALLFTLAAWIAACGSVASDTRDSGQPAKNDAPTSVTLEPAELVLKNGRIITVDDARPEAHALAVRAGRVIAIGADAEIAAYIGPATRVIDLEGKLATPGFIEGHGHFLGLGAFRSELDLTVAKSWDEIVVMVGEAAKKASPGEWIRGRGWHQEKWNAPPAPSIDGMPTNVALSRASPDHPVVLVHASGHACIANDKALELAGVSATTHDPQGGTVVKDASGRPSGILLERAEGLVEMAREALPTDAAQRRATTRRYIELAMDECLSKGITSFQDAGSSLETVALLRELADAHELRLRMWVMLGDPDPMLAGKLASVRTIGAGDGFLTVRAIKRYMDGALGTHTAWLLEPYSDLKTESGMNTNSLESIAATARLARDNGFQLCVHAIGDRANRETLNVFEQTLGAEARSKDLRWRIEHAQHLDPLDIPRFAQLGVIASMQGVHCTSDGPWVFERLGAKRAESGAYVWQKLLHTGAVVSNGTDTPVEDCSPIACYYATVSRKLKDGSRFFPDQRLSRAEALRSYTWSPAFAAFEEREKGSLAVGKLADIVVWSKDFLSIAEDEIPSAKVVFTIVAGKIAYAGK